MATRPRASARAVALGALLAASAGQATDRFVARHGTDAANPCTSAATPCRTVERAVAIAGAGDAVKVGGGTFRTSLRLDRPASVRIEGGWDTAFATRDPLLYPTVLRARARAYETATGRVRDRRVMVAVAEAGESVDVVLDGLSLERGRAQTSDTGDPPLVPNVSVAGGGALWLYGAGGTVRVMLREVTVRRCSSRLAGAGAALVVATAGGTADLVVDRSLVTGSASEYGTVWVAAVVDGTAHARFENSVIADNVAERTPALYVEQLGGSASADVVASTVARNLSTAAEDYPAGAIGAYAGTVRLLDTIVWGNRQTVPTVGGDVVVGALSTVTLDHTDVGSLDVLPGLGGVLDDLGGNISVDPGLDGSRLTSGSPAIDAGTCSGAPPVDADGDPRPTGAGCDIGADEFVP